MLTTLGTFRVTQFIVWKKRSRRIKSVLRKVARQNCGSGTTGRCERVARGGDSEWGWRFLWTTGKSTHLDIHEPKWFVRKVTSWGAGRLLDQGSITKRGSTLSLPHSLQNARLSGMKRNTRLVPNYEPVEYQTHSFIHLYGLVLTRLNKNRLVKGNGKFHPITGHEGPEGE